MGGAVEGRASVWSEWARVALSGYDRAWRGCVSLNCAAPFKPGRTCWGDTGVEWVCEGE